MFEIIIKHECIANCNILLYNKYKQTYVELSNVFEWDDEKDKKNKLKHGIGFNTAILVFADKDRIEKYDEAHSIYEDRYITIGEINGTFMVVTVVYTERRENIRIIPARLATGAEKEAYYDSKNNS